MKRRNDDGRAILNMRSDESVTIDILGTASQFFWGVVVLVFQYLAISAALAVAPAIFVVLPPYLLWQNPNGDYGWLGAVIFFAAPWSCAFYMGILAGWGWRKEHGDYLEAVSKCFLFTFGGLIASYLFEGLYLFVAMRLFPVLHGTISHAAAFESLLIAAFVPTLFLIRRRNYN